VRKQLPSLLSIAVTAIVLCGCAELVPGLNVPEGNVGVHPFSSPVNVTANTTWPPYGPVKVPPPPSDVPEPVTGTRVPKYEVVRVTPGVVADLLQRGNTLFDPSTLKLPTVTPSDVPPEYRIGPGDLVFVTVWEHPELTEPAGNLLRDADKDNRLVASDGTMYYPYVGKFHVAGMTCPEARDYITEHLVRAVVDPKVDIRVMTFRAQRVQITGEVKNPGTLTLDDTPKGILQAIDASGGLTGEASRRRAILIRNHQKYRIDLVSLISGDGPARNLMLQPGDEIHIPNKAEDKIYVLGEVDQQQPVTMQQTTMPLVEALSISGGLQKLRANDSGVLIFRMNDTSSDIIASVYALDMETPEGMLLASEFPLESRDIVYVKATKFAQYNTVIGEILPTVQTAYEIHQITRNR
jgi:polysaccharide export outer membrane protein